MPRGDPPSTAHQPSVAPQFSSPEDYLIRSLGTREKGIAVTLRSVHQKKNRNAADAPSRADHGGRCAPPAAPQPTFRSAAIVQLPPVARRFQIRPQRVPKLPALPVGAPSKNPSPSELPPPPPTRSTTPPLRLGWGLTTPAGDLMSAAVSLGGRPN
eukprot:gene14120-biopygen5088